MAHEARRAPLITPPPGLFGIHIVRPIEVAAPEIPEEVEETVIHADEAHQPDGTSPDRATRRLSVLLPVGVLVVLLPLAIAVLLNRGGVQALVVSGALLVLYLVLGVFPVWNAARERTLERARVEQALRTRTAAGETSPAVIEDIERD